MKISLTKAQRTFLLLTIFSIAMGFFEGIVVVYLRELYYPNGFHFPLTFFSEKMLSIELTRELSTLVMLVTIGILAGKNPIQRFAYFLYCFAVWDIVYYAAIKLFLDWPSSFLTWDILFLIPVAWVGPVLAPIICSLTMILLAVVIIYFREKGVEVKIKTLEWAAILIGAFIIFCTFIWDYASIIITGGFLSDFFSIAKDERFIKIITGYTPVFFNWYLFSLGEILILFSIAMIFKHAKSVFEIAKQKIITEKSKMLL